MDIENFIQILGTDFYTGVPDSYLKTLYNFLWQQYGVDGKHHIIAANEGNCVGIAAGYYLATGKVPVVYMQNSGEGNIVNPAASLLSEKVYGIPMIFLIGWRGEPGVHDEPQHITQGKITLQLLDVLGIEYFVLDKETSDECWRRKMCVWRELLMQGKQVAVVVKKDALSYELKPRYINAYGLKREDVIRSIISITGDAPIVCTTGKASRELFELREEYGRCHEHDFLTVGSMGHASSIALGIALQNPQQKVWCIDGDGAAIMHMGAMGVIGSRRLANFVHIIINNEAHESVGGLPTVAQSMDFVAIAKGCGYQYAVKATNELELRTALREVQNYKGLCFMEICCAIGSRADLGRPTVAPKDNKQAFMRALQK